MTHARRAVFVPECAKLLCFRYYSGLNLSCLAQSEPLSLPGAPPQQVQAQVQPQVQPQVQVQRLRGRAAKSSHRPGPGGSSDSDSEAETSSKQRKQKSWRLHKKKAARSAKADKAERDTRRIVNGFAELDVNKDQR